MAGMQRFVTYIYAYENGEKTKSAGYAKVETRGSNGRMEIHFMGDEVSGGAYTVNFLLVEGGRLNTIPLGTLQTENGRGMGQYTFPTEMKLDTKHSFEEMSGVEIVNKSGQIYRSFWRDVDLASVMRQENEVPAPKVEVSEELTKTMRTQEEAVAKKAVEVQSEKDKKEKLEDAEQESLHTMELPMRNIFPAFTMEDIWRNLEKNRKGVQINQEVCALQIELNDLRELPKRYWYLGNNSFLLHGFFNYHHLLLGKLPEGRWFLGVPGVYERQERVMASVFGFPGFVHIAEPAAKEGEMPSEVSPREMQRGVWYHMLED